MHRLVDTRNSDHNDAREIRLPLSLSESTSLVSIACVSSSPLLQSVAGAMSAACATTTLFVIGAPKSLLLISLLLILAATVSRLTHGQRDRPIVAGLVSRLRGERGLRILIAVSGAAGLVAGQASAAPIRLDRDTVRFVHAGYVTALLRVHENNRCYFCRISRRRLSSAEWHALCRWIRWLSVESHSPD